jgi:O-Antigen ligase
MPGALFAGSGQDAVKEHLSALVYILVIAGACFLVMAKPLTARLMAPADFARRRNLWIAVTVATFLAHNFWLAMLASALIVGFGARREQNPAALYCALLFAVPQFDTQISGFGVINYLFEINHPRMLALVLLLPAALRLAGQARAANPRLNVPDALFSVYFIYVFVATATADSVTGLMRYTVYVLLDHALLYYVITRSVVDRRRLLDLMAAFIMGVAVVGVIGGFENVRNWLVYESLRLPLGVPLQDIGTYLLRETEDGGYLRAYATMGHAIALGFTSMVAITWLLALAPSFSPRAPGMSATQRPTHSRAPKLLGMLVMLMPLIGLLAAVSRGPWLGCAIVMVLGLSFGPGAKQRLLWMLAALPLIIAALLILPQGQKFIDLLPFVGTVDPGSVSYRTQLLDRAMIVFWQSPIFGSLHYLQNPALESMRQGQGIIDIVNSYVGVALAFGGIGLVLFVAPSAYALWTSWTTSRHLALQDPDAESAGRALAASMLGILLVIGAASHYFHIPIVHWMTVSVCAAFAASAPSWRKAPASTGRAPHPNAAAARTAPQPMRPSPRRHA